jgi:hypothetical protein
LELPNYCVSIIRTCKWYWILSFPENRGTDHFGELPFHWQLSMASNDALAIYYGSCNRKTCCDTLLNVCVDSNDMILQLWRYHSYKCQGSNDDPIDCSTLHSMHHRYVYVMCILHSPPRLMGSTITVPKRRSIYIDCFYGTWLMWSQTNSFVVCTLWCLTLMPAF